MKKSNILIYGILIGLILVYVFFTQGDAIPALRYVAFVILILIALVLLSVLILCIYLTQENKKINSYIDKKQYEEAILFCQNKINKYASFPIRRDFFRYMLILSFFSLKNIEAADKEIELLQDKSSYPLIYYWKMCYEFVNQDYTHITEYSDSFFHSKDYNKNPRAYAFIASLIQAMKAYVIEDVETLKQCMNGVNENDFTMPYAILTIQILKEKK